jgi:hypothetical protein
MKTGIRIEALAAVLLACAPAFAQAPPSDTLKVVLAKGAVFTVEGRNYEFVPRPDGSYADIKGAAMGKYRIDGKTLCVTPTEYGTEACFVFPEAKASGDKFDVTNEHGQPAAVTMR